MTVRKFILFILGPLMIIGFVTLLVKRAWQTMPRWQRLWVFIGAPIIVLEDVVLNVSPHFLRGAALAPASTIATTIAMCWGIAVEWSQHSRLTSRVGADHYTTNGPRCLTKYYVASKSRDDSVRGRAVGHTPRRFLKRFLTRV